jgi:hypothetical protein
MNPITTDGNQLFTAFLTALQSSITGYPTYNLLTQFQDSIRSNLLKSNNNPLLNKGQKYFSQNDEDGITLEILNRIGLLNSNNSKNFIEFGVGNGLENNSLILLMHGFKGVWVGNEDLAINLDNSKRLEYIKTWLTLDNIHDTFTQAVNYINTTDIDVLSIDLDGNDIYFINYFMLSKCFPKIIITEYNGKFPPPVEFTIDYDSNHIFNSDYMGASLQSFYNLLKFQYKLICCNIAGCNAFFVRNDFAYNFLDVPENISEIFMPANYGIVTRMGHPVSPKTIEYFIR